MSGEAEAAVRSFVAWVATSRAHNGSDHRYGQSLYNECLNAVLPLWAEEWLTLDCDTGYFDRTLCPEPCGYMHSFCTTCGERQDPCAHESNPEASR